MRYHLHALARAFAEGELDISELEIARKRHAENYLNVLRIANDLYLQGGQPLNLALRLFDAEWTNIQTGFDWSSQRLFEDDTAARFSNEYPRAGMYLLDLRQYPRERVRWQEIALEAARQRLDKASEGLHLGNMGRAYESLGETRRAIELAEQALAINREVGNRRGEGFTLGNLGQAYRALGETRRAIELYEQALTITREIGDRRGEGFMLGSLGQAYRALGETRRAVELYEQDLTITREIGDRQGERGTLLETWVRLTMTSVRLGAQSSSTSRPLLSLEKLATGKAKRWSTGI